MFTNASINFHLRIRRLLLAFFGALLLSCFSITDLSAQGRSNKGGEVRGKDRASQVQEMNESSKDERDAAKAEKNAAKEKKGKKGKRGKKKDK